MAVTRQAVLIVNTHSQTNPRSLCRSRPRISRCRRAQSLLTRLLCVLALIPAVVGGRITLRTGIGVGFLGLNIS
jgi:hypothetical protein